MSYIHGKTLIKIAVADDHALLRQTLCSLINTWDNCKVISEASTGKDLIDKIDPKNLPDLIIIDLGMPKLNGFDTIKILKKLHPSLKFMAISIYQGEETIIRLLKAGGTGFLHKSEDASKFRKAIYEMMHSGYYFSDQAACKLVRQLLHNKDFTIKNDLSDEEINFLKKIITEKTYLQIADEMNIPARRIEYLRKTLFEHFDVKSRTGLAVQAVEKGLTL